MDEAIIWGMRFFYAAFFGDEGRIQNHARNDTLLAQKVFSDDNALHQSTDALC